MFPKRAIIVWLSIFATFLACLSSFYNAVLVLNQGADTIVNPYILGSILANQSAQAYLWLSILATCIFLAVTCILVYRRTPPDTELIRLLLKIGGNLAALRKSQEAQTAEFADQMEHNRKINRQFFSTVTTGLEEGNKKTEELLAAHEKTAKKGRQEIVATLEKTSTESDAKLSADLKRQEAVINGVKRLSEENSSSLKSQKAVLDEMKVQLEGIQCNMVPNQPQLKSIDSPEEIKGIGPSLGKELRLLGIDSVGDFLTTDPVIIGEKTRVSQDMAENLQAMAQLMMVPGVDANDAELLMEAGIKSRRQLADQDVIVLSRKVGEVAKIYLDQGKITKQEYPTIEEIASWIRNA
ncbi:MAG: DUF4332 domain-containing protein [Candidatus Bathyarchaeia archaeon]